MNRNKKFRFYKSYIKEILFYVFFISLLTPFIFMSDILLYIFSLINIYSFINIIICLIKLIKVIKIKKNELMIGKIKQINVKNQSLIFLITYSSESENRQIISEKFSFMNRLIYMLNIEKMNELIDKEITFYKYNDKAFIMDILN